MAVGSSLGATLLSKNWVVEKSHTGAYSGGTVTVSSNGSLIACLCDRDVCFVDVELGTKRWTLRGHRAVNSSNKAGHDEVIRRREAIEEEEEEVVCFSLPHKKNSFKGTKSDTKDSEKGGELEIMVATRNLLLRRWILRDGGFTIVNTIKAHDQVVLSMEYDRSGTLVATGSADRTVKVWDVNRGYCTHNFRGHQGTVSLVRFHPDRKRLLLVSAGEDCSVRLWDLQTSTSFAVLKDHMSVPTGLDFLPEYSDVMLTAGRDQVVNIWQIRGASDGGVSHLHTLPTYEVIEGVLALPVPSSNFICDGKGHIEGGGKLTKEKRSRECTQVCHFALAGQRGLVRVYRLLLLTLERKKRKLLGSDTTHPVGHVVVRGCQCITEQMSRASQPPYRQLLWKCKKEGEEEGRIIAVSEDHNFVILSATLGLPTWKLIIGFNDEILDMKTIPAEKKRCCKVAVATNSPQVRLFDLKTFSAELLDGHKDIVLALDVSPDGQLLATASKDRSCRLWDMDLLQSVATYKGHMAAVGAIALSRRKGPYIGPSGAFLISGSADKLLKKWLIEYRSEKTEVSKALLSSIPSATIKAHEKDINHVCISPNDRLIASASQDRTAKVWNSGDLSLVATLLGHKRGVWRVEFNPVDKCLATASGDRTIRVWSGVDFTCLRTLQGHTASVLNLQFVTVGAQMISSGSDGLLKLWTLRTGVCEGTFDAHDSKVWALALSKSEDDDALGAGGANAGLRVVSGGVDSVINVWRDTTAEEEEFAAKGREEAILQDQELQNCMRASEYAKALDLGFRLNRPRQVFQIIVEVLNRASERCLKERKSSNGPNSVTATEVAASDLDGLVRSWSDEQLATCFSFCKEWNCNARKAHVVNTLLGSVLRTVHLQRLAGLDGSSSAADALLAYNERHYNRLDRLLQEACLGDYALANMHVLEAQEEPSTEAGVEMNANYVCTGNGKRKVYKVVEDVTC